MKLTQMFFKTYREDPVDAEIKSHKLLVRAGYIKKQTAGVYVFLPLGLRSLHKLTNVIREEMDKSGANEVLMSNLLPADVYAGRINHFGSDMFRLNDRTGKEMCLGPSHEEIFAGLIKDAVTSYKQLPIMMYQIQNKFRDEVRPRFGLIRNKEFLMKDAYSFDTNLENLDKSYQLMAKTYRKIFDRLQLNYVVVDADNGTMGGSASQEFMVKNNIGEDEIVVCHSCGYAGNTEKATSQFVEKPSQENHLTKELIHTPNMKTVEDLVKFFGKNESDFLKAVVYSYDKGIVVSLLPGDREIEEVKLSRILNTIKLEMATYDDINNIGSVAGYVGALNLKNCIVVADRSVKNMANFIIGGNKSDYHYKNANLEDINIDQFGDIIKVKKGDVCTKCGKELDVIRGIEVGHIFKQETKYTKLLDVKYLNEQGKSEYIQMGAYGIGVTRTLSALVEQFSDDRGIILPDEIAPYRVYLATVNQKDKDMADFAERLYNDLQNSNVETLFDDRLDSIGVKLKDGELIGASKIIVVGRDYKEEKVELIDRKSLSKEIVEIKNLMKIIK